MKKKVYFRADGDNKTGLGHVVRSCALAAMLKDEFGEMNKVYPKLMLGISKH